MADLVFPTNQQLALINQELVPELARQRLVFSFFPMLDKETHLVEWEQRDNYVGLQQVRGLNGDPARVQRVGSSKFAMQPGIYGEYIPIDEVDLTTRRQLGTFGTPIDITDLVREAQDQLLGRRLDRIEKIGWDLLVNGTFSVLRDNVILHTDTYTTQTFTSGPAWSSVATATPIADFRAVQLLARGLSVSFGPAARAIMNQTTFNTLLSNTNSADLGGRRLQGLMPVNGPQQLNILLGAEGLPSVEVYDQGYLNDSGVFTLFIPDNRIVVLGQRRDNDPIGAYVMTRNANNPGMAPGAYMKVVDNGDREVPRRIAVHDGHNGGPVLYHPAAIVVMDVS